MLFVSGGRTAVLMVKEGVMGEGEREGDKLALLSVWGACVKDLCVRSYITAELSLPPDNYMHIHVRTCTCRSTRPSEAVLTHYTRN